MKKVWESVTLRYAFYVLLALWLAAQIIVLCIVEDIPQSSDGLRYQTLAEECFDAGAWYPMSSQIENYHEATGQPAYICYVGLINFLIICLKCFGTIKAAYWFNIGFNCMTLWCLGKIGERLVSRNFGLLVMVLYCLFLPPVEIVGNTLSELPCIGLIYLSVELASRKRYLWIICAGIIIVVAQYIRSVALIFAITMLIYMIYSHYGWKRVVTFLISGTATYALILSFNYQNTGYRFFSTSTLGTNMLQGANSIARGNYNNADSIAVEIDPQLEGKNVFQIDSINRAYTKKWIEENPGRWALLSAPKIYYQLRPASYVFHLGRSKEAIINPGKPVGKIAIIGIKAYSNIYQFGLIFLMLYGLWIRRRSLWGIDGIILLPFLGGLALAILTVGHPRYNMPFEPVMIYFAALALMHIYKKIKWRHI